MRIILFSGAFVLGVLGGSKLDLSALPFLITALLLIPLLVIFRRHRSVLLVVVLAALALGVSRGTQDSSNPERSDLSYYNDLGEVQIQGVVATYPEPRETLTQFRFDVASVISEGQSKEISGSVLVRARPALGMVQLRDPP